MEAPPTYQQLLAEQYAENERERMGYIEEFDDEEEYNVRERELKNYEPNILENPDYFNKHQGDRGAIEIVIPPKEFEDKTRQSIRYNKDVTLHVVNIDSRFRGASKPSSSTITLINGQTLTNTTTATSTSDFTVLLPKPIKNAISMKITSISIPNEFYTFSAARENISFKLYHYEVANNPPVTITIPEGNYTSIQQLVDVIEDRLQLVGDLDNPTIFPYHISYDSTSNRVTIYKDRGGGAEITNTFGLDFTPENIETPFDNGLGYYLGYDNLKYGTAPANGEIPSSLTSMYIIDILTFVKDSMTNVVTAYTPNTYGIIVGTSVTISSSTASAGNLGTFTVSAVTPNTSISYTNASGITQSRNAKAMFTGRYECVSEGFPEADGDHYILLGINDYINVEHQSFNQTFFPAFAKILLPNDSKNKLINDITLTNVVQKEYYFIQPLNLNRIDISLYDPYGNIIDMKKSNFSMTLEIQEVLNQGLYDKLREL